MKVLKVMKHKLEIEQNHMLNLNLLKKNNSIHLLKKGFGGTEI